MASLIQVMITNATPLRRHGSGDVLVPAEVTVGLAHQAYVGDLLDARMAPGRRTGSVGYSCRG